MKRQHKLLWSSSYDRGLNVLLDLWPDIKAKYPDATLDCAYGWNLYDTITVGNAERTQWKAKMVELMKQEGITEHGRIGKKELQKLRQECGILAYSSDFTEIFCISAMEAQLDGCVPITPDLAALGEYTTGRVIVKGDIYNPMVKKEYLKELLALMGDEERWLKLQKEGIEYAKNFTWDKMASEWVKDFEKLDQSVKVSINTPTNRRGFWNIMADNLSKQTYKNFEWNIIDDYEEDRSEIAKEYAKKYNLDIRYFRGKPHKIKRNYALVNANNTGWLNATGELIVMLQDFILIPQTGIEDLVNVYKKNPDTAIACVDTYYAPKVKPDTSKEDWFNGELDVQGEFMRSNIRIQNKGLRLTENAYDLENNYNAIPKKIIDDLGGWYEFFDFGLGFDNTELAYRLLEKGYKIMIDETNIATCIDHWNALEGTKEHGLGRERNLNDAHFLFLISMIGQGRLPLKRTQEIDDKINLSYEMPKDLPKGDEVKWIKQNMDQLVLKWQQEVKL